MNAESFFSRFWWGFYFWKYEYADLIFQNFNVILFLIGQQSFNTAVLIRNDDQTESTEFFWTANKHISKLHLAVNWTEKKNPSSLADWYCVLMSCPCIQN